MKAWLVSDAYGNAEGGVVVFSETRGKAKQEAMRDFDDCDYTDLRAVRAKKLDGMEGYEPTDNYWLNEDIRLILVKEYGWHCLEYDDTDCGHCIARNYCNVVAEGY